MTMKLTAIKSAIILLGVLVTVCAKAAGSLPEITVYEIKKSHQKELSGLAICDGRLLTVADNVNDKVYEINIQGLEAVLEHHLTLHHIPRISVAYSFAHQFKYFWANVWKARMDWEGISCDANHLYLASENRLGILQVANGSSVWLPLSLYSEAQARGHLSTYNGFVEGLIVSDDTIYGFFERASRGVFRINRATMTQVEYGYLPNNMNLNFVNDSEDVAGAFIDGGWLYTLERSASSICKRRLSDYVAEDCLSYKSVEEDPQYKFKDSVYGIGEGLAMDKNHIYVIFDSNGKPRVAKDSGLSLLLKIKRPSDW